MASIIKNQILKHLSKFAKNLSLDKLHLSTLKGHGELHNLELDEKVLTELLELPAWLRLTCATCNHVTLKIHWTKLKSVPIYLSLDEVIVNLETCEDLRPPTPLSSDHSYYSGGKYGFSDRVIDGMTVVVNSVHINFTSPAFQASFQLSRVVLESYSPDWKKKDIRLSRIKDTERGELLLFKRLDWQVLRIEAKSRDNHAHGVRKDIPLTPLRLITNQACCKMTFKKKLSDCSLIGSRLVFIFDDLLWVLTDAQLVAALHFLQSLSGLVQKATLLTQKQKAKKKIEQQPEKHHAHAKASSRLSPVFMRNDVIETSYHVLCSCIDLHLCDDMDPEDGRSQHPSLRSGGALQVSLHKLVMDYYPYHHAFSGKEHWLRYTEPSSSHNAWVQQLLSLFQERDKSKGPGLDGTGSKNESPKHASVCRLSSISSTDINDNATSGYPTSPDDKQPLTRKASTTSTASETGTSDTSKKSPSSRKLSMQQNYRYLMSSSFLLRLENIVAYKVSTSNASRKAPIEKFLIYNKNANLPSDIKTIHLEHTMYYLPGDLDYPVPAPHLSIYLGPLKLYLDTPTILWMNAFYLNLQKCLMSMKTFTPETPSQVSIRFEALMPQVVIPSDQQSPSQPDRPKTLQFQASRIIATNCRVGDHASLTNLHECLEVLSSSNVLSDTGQFPWEKDDKKPISEVFLQHLLDKDSESTSSVSAASTPKGVIGESTDIWSIHFDPLWAEFTVCEAGHTRLQSFIDPLLLTLWLYRSVDTATVLNCQLNTADYGTADDSRMSLPGLNSCQNNINCDPLPSVSEGRAVVNAKKGREDETDIYVLMHIHSLLNIQLTHFQYLFVMRASDMITDMMENLTLDTAAIIKDKPISSVCMCTYLARIEVALVLRNLNQLSATSDSADLASLQEDGSSNSDLPPIKPKSKMIQSQSSFSIGEIGGDNKQTSKQGKIFDKSCASMLGECCTEGSVPKSRSDSLLNCHSSSSQSPTSPLLPNQTSIDFTVDIQKNLHSGTSAVKRGFSSFVASIDSAFTKSDFHSLDAESAAFQEEDTLSLKSDASYDLDQFVLVNQDGALDDEFFHHPQSASVDVAVEAKEDTFSNYTLNSEKKREMVSIVLFAVNQVGVVVQSQLSSCVIMKCNDIEVKEEAAISWENFQHNFSSRSRGWRPKCNSESKSHSELNLRLYKKDILSSETITKLDEGPGFVWVGAQNYNIQMSMSNVACLVEFFEDEIIAKPLPSKIVLQNLQILLQDDGNPSADISTPVPLRINLPGCILDRTEDGTLSVLPLVNGYTMKNLNDFFYHPSKSEVSCELTDNSSANETTCQCAGVTNGKFATDGSKAENNSSFSCDIFKQPLTRLMEDNEQLKSKLIQMSNLQLENEMLREELRNLRNSLEGNNLAKQLSDSKIEIQRLEEEKRTLQETLKFLQKDINSHQREQRQHTSLPDG